MLIFIYVFSYVVSSSLEYMSLVREIFSLCGASLSRRWLACWAREGRSAQCGQRGCDWLCQRISSSAVVHHFRPDAVAVLNLCRHRTSMQSVFNICDLLGSCTFLQFLISSAVYDFSPLGSRLQERSVIVRCVWNENSEMFFLLRCYLFSCL